MKTAVKKQVKQNQQPEELTAEEISNVAGGKKSCKKKKCKKKLCVKKKPSTDYSGGWPS